MESHSQTQRTLSQMIPIVGYCFLVFTAIVLLNSVQIFVYQYFAGFDMGTLAHSRQLPPGQQHLPDPSMYIRFMSAVWYPRALFSPFIIYLALKYRVDPKSKFKGLSLQFVCGVLLGLIVTLIQAGVVDLIVSIGPDQYEAATRLASRHAAVGTIPYWLETGLMQGRNYISYNILTFWALTGLLQGWYFYGDVLGKQMQTSKLEAQLASMKLEVLRMQLNPHFLFNTLHAIGTLIYDEPSLAEDMLLRLSKLLRVFLDESNPHEIPLRQEIQFVEWHLGIERVRFGDRLKTEITADSEAMGCSVPHLILQPLVENAIQHGLAKHAGNDLVSIRCSIVGERLQLEVSNQTGVFPSSSDQLKFGIGLSNTRSRLQTLYKEDSQLVIESGTPQGVTTRLSFPIRHIGQNSPLPLEVS